MDENCLILGIETSCDETSAAVVKDGREVLANVITSQINLHKKFGGVVPELASRKHVELINPVVQQALDEAGVVWRDLDGVAVTYGPGLVGALLVGVSAAKAIAFAHRLPLLAVNHIEAHIYANFLAYPDLEPPLVCLVVSGGHTELVYLEGAGQYKVLGRTRDDAAGEAFDKVARAVGIGYPGGPLIDRLAQQGDAAAVELPRAWLEEDSLDFSFSGLKSAVLNYLQKMQRQGQKWRVEDLAASFQQAVMDVLVEKTVRAARYYRVKRVALAGGVAANSALRRMLGERLGQEGRELYYPPPVLCTDNAAMVACLGYHQLKRGERSSLFLNAVPSLHLGEKKYPCDTVHR